MGEEFHILGPPGTGKTTYLSRQIESAVKKHGSSSVFISSFTKAAAQELVSRNLPVERNQIGTLHSHCYRSLSSPTIAETKIDLWNKDFPQYSLQRESSLSPMDEPDYQLANARSDGDKFYSEMQISRAQMKPQDRWPITVRAFYRKWCEWKKAHEFVDFTDMLELGLENMFYAPGNPSIGFFDEVQDFSKLELSIVRKWGRSMDYFLLAGDDDQAIYGFKGATPEAFMDTELLPGHSRVLSQSFRLPRVIHSATESWIKKVKHRVIKDYSPRDFEGSVDHLSNGYWNEPTRIIDLASRIVDQGKTVMILGACGYHISPTVRLLKDSGIPFHNPYRRKRGDWNPLSMTRGDSISDRILAYLRPEPEVWGNVSRMWLGYDLQLWLPLIDSKEALHRGSKTKVDSLPETEEILVSQLTTLLKEDVLQQLLFASSLEERLQWLWKYTLKSKHKYLLFPKTVLKKYGSDGLKKTPKIIVGTIHSVKGGEADVVILFPDLSRQGFEAFNYSDREGVIRQFYVGMTRARESLYWGTPQGYSVFS
ncbi:MAG: ATP-dependent helicase [Nitrososphaerales archaeon]